MEHISPLTNSLISALESESPSQLEGSISINPAVSKLASWYEKIRNAMEYREEEVVLRAAVERILRRRLMLGGTAETIAEPLLRELLWAGYFSQNQAGRETIVRVQKTLELYLELRNGLLRQAKLSTKELNNWIYELASSEIARVVNPSRDKELLANFMFQVLRPQVVFENDDTATRDAQVFLAIRRTFAKDDNALLRYLMFREYFGPLTRENLPPVLARFSEGYREIEKQLCYPRKEAVAAYVRRQVPVFLILEDLLRSNGRRMRELLGNDSELEKTVLAICNLHYTRISSLVQRAIVRSVVFIIMTKLFIVFAFEATYEQFVYGEVQWGSIAINTGIPPLLMVIVGSFIRPPSRENSKEILAVMRRVLSEDQPELGRPLVLGDNEEVHPLFRVAFTLLWGLAFVISFGAIITVLTKLQFRPVSQAVFLFFLAVVSFLTYRITLMAHVYNMDNEQGLLTPVVDFFFMPVVRVGRRLTEGVSQLNFLAFVLDAVIEAPFKGMFGFFEQWFLFLHAKREELE